MSMGFFRSIDRAQIGGHEIDVNVETVNGMTARLYVDGQLVDMKPISLITRRQVLTTNLDGSKLEVQIRAHWISKGEVWAVWRGQHFQFSEIE